MLADELHFRLNFGHDPYDVVDPTTNRHYFVDFTRAVLTASSEDRGDFYLPLRDRPGDKYVLHWTVQGEFDRYEGSTPPLPTPAPQ